MQIPPLVQPSPRHQAHPCSYVRTYWHERKSGYWWGPVHRLGWDAGAL